jgi:hypothetical protein
LPQRRFKRGAADGARSMRSFERSSGFTPTF